MDNNQEETKEQSINATPDVAPVTPDQPINPEAPTTPAAPQKEPELKTIMPTMVDMEEDEKEEKKQDLSAIVPKSTTLGSEGLKIESKDAELKADGSVVLGTVQGEGIAMTDKVQLPDQIDVAERVKEAKALREGKAKKKKVRDVSKIKKEIRTLNKKTIIALVLILILAGSVIYILKSPKMQDFQPKPVQIELGDGLPLHADAYVQPAVGQKVDDLTEEYNLEINEN